MPFCVVTDYNIWIWTIGDSVQDYFGVVARQNKADRNWIGLLELNVPCDVNIDLIGGWDCMLTGGASGECTSAGVWESSTRL